MVHKTDIQVLLSQKTKHAFVKEGIQHFTDKLFPYAKITVLEAKNEKSFEQHCQKLEKSSVTIILHEKGRQYSSTSFSETWGSLINQRAKSISFIIGGPYGFTYEPRADLTLSLSSLTHNHELIPIILLEQVYRSYAILNGLPYHHA